MISHGASESRDLNSHMVVNLSDINIVNTPEMFSGRDCEEPTGKQWMIPNSHCSFLAATTSCINLTISDHMSPKTENKANHAAVVAVADAADDEDNRVVNWLISCHISGGSF